jgi:hypothetical protein
METTFALGASNAEQWRLDVQYHPDATFALSASHILYRTMGFVTCIYKMEARVGALHAYKYFLDKLLRTGNQPFPTK